MNKLSNEDAAYLAGFVDGEGCISYAKYQQSGGTYYHLAIIISNTNREVLEWICLAVGEGRVRETKQKPRSKRQYVVRWSYNVALQVLEQVLPYLKVKRSRAELVLDISKRDEEVRAAAGISNFGSKGIPQELVAARHEVYLQMKELNKRGVN